MESEYETRRERNEEKSDLHVVTPGACVVCLCACCKPMSPPRPPAAGTRGEMSERCGDMSQLADRIYLYTWVEYIDPEIKDMFQEECGVEVVETNFDSNETLLATLQAGGADYDIIVPSDYMVQIMIDEGMLMELDYT
jgi:spermidine/putrescine-binding protein